MASTTIIDLSLDYVDDSEPERKRVKLQASGTKRRRSCPKQHQRQNTDVAHDPPRFNRALTCHRSAGSRTFGLSESVAAGSTSDNMESAVIDIMGGSKGRCSKSPSESPSQVPPEISHLRTSRAFTPQVIPGSNATGTQEVPSESNIIPCLGHLAYYQVRRASNVSDSSRERHRSVSTSQIHNSKVEGLSQETLQNPSVTKFDVGPLLRCVSCEVGWTVQKGAAQKLSHITTCARKNGINPSTLQRLVEKELLKMRNAKTDDQKTTSHFESVDETYMGSVVAAAQPRRKQKRVDTAGTLQPVSQTKAAILDRAKALLGTWEALPSDAPEPEHSQTFGRSKLAVGRLQMENTGPIVLHLSEERALASRLALLRSMADSPTTRPS